MHVSDFVKLSGGRVLTGAYEDREIACGYTADYECITGVGTVDIINGIEKLTGLNTIVKKYAENISDKRFSEEMLNNVVVLKLTVNEFCCKAHKLQN